MDKIYFGEGTYDTTTMEAEYTIELPEIPGATYKFSNPVYNLSKETSRVMIIMEMVGKPDVDLNRYVTGVPLTFNFSLNTGNLQNIDAKCPKLTNTDKIYIIVFHDDEYDLQHAKEEFYDNTSVWDDLELWEKFNTEHFKIVTFQPKTFGLGTLRPV